MSVTYTAEVNLTEEEVMQALRNYVAETKGLRYTDENGPKLHVKELRRQEPGMYPGDCTYSHAGWAFKLTGEVWNYGD